MSVKLTPVWFDMPRSFYVELEKATEECGMSAVQVLRRGVRLVLKEHRKTQNAEHRSEDSDDKVKMRSRAAKVVAAERWKGVSAEERREFARQMALKRWSNKTKTPPSVKDNPPSPGKS